jgi:hypothetical protein
VPKLPAQDHLPELLGALVTDVISLGGIPGGALLGTVANRALQNYMDKRLTKAREILLDSVKLGELHLSEKDMEESVAIVFRYQRAVIEGAANLNLRLLAQAIAGGVVNGTLSAGQYSRDAEIIASLSREEIVVLAKLHHVWKSEWLMENEPASRFKVASDWVQHCVVPDLLPSEDEFNACLGSLLRTGLVIQYAAFGTSLYGPAPRLSDFAERASLDEALRKE